MNDFDIGIHRDGGLTHVLDKGLGPRAWTDILETSGEYIDIVKLGWGTAWVTNNLRAKLEVLREKPIVIGGTFFEVVYARDRLEEYKRWLVSLGIDAHGNSLYRDVQARARRKLEELYDRL